MRADVPIGTGLSGGVDSSAVVACISQVSKSSGVERVSDDWQNSLVASSPGTVMDYCPEESVSKLKMKKWGSKLLHF